MCHKNTLSQDTFLSGPAQALGPLKGVNVRQYAEWTFTIISGTRKWQKSFSWADKDAVLSAWRCCCCCCSLFKLAFEAACCLIEFIIPILDLVRMAASHSDRGSRTLPVVPQPPPPPPTKSRTIRHSSQPCDEDPGATGTWFTTARCKRWLDMIDYSKAQEHCCPKYCTQQPHTLCFVYIILHNVNGGNGAGKLESWCLAEWPDSWQLREKKLRQTLVRRIVFQ